MPGVEGTGRSGFRSLFPSVLRRLACKEGQRETLLFQPSSLDPIQTLLPLTWVLLSPSLLPPSAPTGKAYSPAGQPFSPGTFSYPGTALVADDSAMKDTSCIRRGFLPSHVIGPRSRKGHDRVSTQPAPGGDHTLGHLCTSRWQGACHTSRLCIWYQ